MESSAVWLSIWFSWKIGMGLRKLKDLMIELLWPFVFVLCSIVKRGKRDTQTHVLFGSIFLFYFICYYGSVSYFLSWSNWTEEPKTDSRPIKEDIFILSQTVTSCELYLITITFFIEWTPKSRNLCPPRRCHFSRQCGILRMAVARRIYRKFSTSRVDSTIACARFALH